MLQSLGTDRPAVTGGVDFADECGIINQSAIRETGRWTAVNSKTFAVPNISCGHCVMTIERELAELAGVASVSADLDSKSVTVEWGSPATGESISGRLAEINYPPAE